MDFVLHTVASLPFFMMFRYLYLGMATERARVTYLRISGLTGLGSESRNLSGLSLGLVFTRTYLMDNRFE